MPKKKDPFLTFKHTQWSRGAETDKTRPAGMAGREEESLDVEIDSMELDEDCLVRVGRAGAGGAGADAQNPAQKEARESRLSTKKQWTERLAVVDAHLCPLDAHLCPLMDNFLRQIFSQSEEEHALVLNQMSPEQAGSLRKQDISHALLFWSALPSAHGGIQSNFNKILVSMCVSTMGGAWTGSARKARTCTPFVQRALVRVSDCSVVDRSHGRFHSGANYSGV